MPKRSSTKKRVEVKDLTAAEQRLTRNDMKKVKGGVAQVGLNVVGSFKAPIPKAGGPK